MPPSHSTDSPVTTRTHPMLRVRDGHEAKVGYAELFFDLVYVFAVTQVSHFLLGNLTPLGAAQALLLWFAVWLGWQYTCWITNWFDPETPRIRMLLFGLMFVSLGMAAALPDAFGQRGLVFACCYALMQVGRALYIRISLGNAPLAANYTRILGWACISAVFWIAGGLQQGNTRMALWAVAVACEYLSPMFGFPLPGLGRSNSQRDWSVEGGHIVERCALFMIVALGESVLVAGATLGHAHHWELPMLLAFAAAFAGSVAMWLVYFGVAVKDATEVIVHAQDPGRYAARFHYLHVLILAGVIVTAVGNDLVIAHPGAATDMKSLLVLVLGPALFLLGSGLYKRVINGHYPRSHLVGLGLLAITLAAGGYFSLLLVNAWTTAVLFVVTGWEWRSRAIRH